MSYHTALFLVSFLSIAVVAEAALIFVMRRVRVDMEDGLKDTIKALVADRDYFVEQLHISETARLEAENHANEMTAKHGFLDEELRRGNRIEQNEELLKIASRALDDGIPAAARNADAAYLAKLGISPYEFGRIIREARDAKVAEIEDNIADATSENAKSQARLDKDMAAIKRRGAEQLGHMLDSTGGVKAHDHDSFGHLPLIRGGVHGQETSGKL